MRALQSDEKQQAAQTVVSRDRENQVKYEDFIASKAFLCQPTGMATVPALSPKLKEHQDLLVRWALRRGRAAIFADTGLGKGWMILEWARCVSEHTGKPVIVLAPLAVSRQFEREAAKLGTSITLCATGEDVRPGINVTNYQKLHKFDVSVFGGVALDEASILKHLDGATRTLLIESFRETQFRLAATATPSPNDHTELGGQSEFLGIMKHQEMLAAFFTRDGGSTQDWELKGHARALFWKWVCSWGAIVKMPSDIGCADDGYVLPPLHYHEHVIPASQDQAWKSGLLFADVAKTLNEQRAARRGSLSERVRISAELANAADGQSICWVDLNDESAALTAAIDGAVEVTGSMSDEEKEAAIESFVSGKARCLVSKGSICGWGLNLQFARTVVFCGVSHSFESFFQSVRRSWRFGVEGEVNAHIVTSEIEGAVVDNLKRKQRDANEMADETRKYVAGHVRESVEGLKRTTIAYKPGVKFTWPSWLKTECA
jgi:superfamily II DNA or RNA helicase